MCTGNRRLGGAHSAATGGRGALIGQAGTVALVASLRPYLAGPDCTGKLPADPEPSHQAAPAGSAGDSSHRDRRPFNGACVEWAGPGLRLLVWAIRLGLGASAACLRVRPPSPPQHGRPSGWLLSAQARPNPPDGPGQWLLAQLRSPAAAPLLLPITRLSRLSADLFSPCRGVSWFVCSVGERSC